MPGKITVNVPPYKGEYEFDIDTEPLTTLEWRWVKKIAGYLPMTIDEGWRGADPDLFVAFAVIAMHRAGKVMRGDVLRVADSLADAPFDGTAIGYTGELPEEDEGDPPAEPAETPETTEPSESGGSSSSPTSDPSETDPSPTGAPASRTSAGSALEISLS